jgi:hypothetical protein
MSDKQWISVGERLPPKMAQVLSFALGHVFEATWDGYCWDPAFDEIWEGRFYVTHWMPMPEPPSEPG